MFFYKSEKLVGEIKSFHEIFVNSYIIIFVGQHGDTLYQLFVLSYIHPAHDDNVPMKFSYYGTDCAARNL